ncbi:MAG: PIN domain-containing protein [Deltaproteobacteria bacterium]|nr:PIN domain-containing protein [Deltaproteobacteria bacterium]MDZ4341796.1 PIN domain-containing protein [Candidatus Binatia bacterium]
MALPARLFCDTSFFYACLDPHDTNHDRAEELTDEAATSATTFFTTWDVVSETVTLLRYRIGFRPAVTFLEEVKPDLTIVEYGQRVRDEAEHIFRRRSRSRRVSFCDAISFVVVTSRLNGMPCLAFDRDFRALGLTVIS